MKVARSAETVVSHLIKSQQIIVREPRGHFVRPRELSAIRRTVCRVRNSVLVVCGLAPKCVLYCYIPVFRKTHTMAIVTTRMRSSHKNGLISSNLRFSANLQQRLGYNNCLSSLSRGFVAGYGCLFWN